MQPPLQIPPVSAACAARGLSVRMAGPADADFQRDVYIAGRWAELAVTGWPQNTIEMFLRDQHRMQTMHYERQYPDAWRLIIECAGVAAGRVILLGQGADMRIVDIGLMPQFRGQGLGGLLMAWVRDIALEQGRAVVSLHVEPNNPAKRLYERLGFKPIELRGAYELMEWPVAGPVS